MKAGIYTRISRDTTGDELGVARQDADCRELCSRLGWEVVDVYSDNDVSAYSGRHRPGYRRLLEDLQAGHLEALAAWHPDRITRSPLELEELIDVIEGAGAAVATVQAGELDLATPAGRMTARVVGAVARHESEHKSARLRRKHLELAEAGKIAGGGSRPFGFESDRLTVRAAEAEVIREAMARFLGGESVRSIAGALNDDQVPTVSGKPWSTNSVRRMLLSARNAGLREHRGEIAGPAVWPAIVSPADRERAVTILKDPARTTWRPATRYLLTGTARCSLCSTPLVARPRQHARSMVCAKGPGFHGCGGIRIMAEPVEELVSFALFERLDGPGLAEALSKSSDDDAGAELATEIEELSRRLEELAEMWAGGEISRAEWMAARKPLEASLEASRRRSARSARRSALGAFLGAPGALEKGWPELTLDRRRAIVSEVVEAVTIAPAMRGRNTFDPGRVALTWRV